MTLLNVDAIDRRQRNGNALRVLRDAAFLGRDHDVFDRGVALRLGWSGYCLRPRRMRAQQAGGDNRTRKRGRSTRASPCRKTNNDSTVAGKRT